MSTENEIQVVYRIEIQNCCHTLIEFDSESESSQNESNQNKVECGESGLVAKMSEMSLKQSFWQEESLRSETFIGKW